MFDKIRVILFNFLTGLFTYTVTRVCFYWVLPTTTKESIKTIKDQHIKARSIVLTQVGKGNTLIKWFNPDKVKLLLGQGITLDAAIINFSYFNDFNSFSDYLDCYCKTDKAFVAIIELIASVPIILSEHGYWDLKENKYTDYDNCSSDKMAEVAAAMNKFLQNALFTALVKAYDGVYTYEEIQSWG